MGFLADLRNVVIYSLNLGSGVYKESLRAIVVIKSNLLAGELRQVV